MCLTYEKIYIFTKVTKPLKKAKIPFINVNQKPLCLIIYHFLKQ